MIKAFALTSSYGNCGVFAPSSRKPASDGSFGYSELGRPVSDMHCYAVCSDAVDASTVAVLSLSVSPNAVTWLISDSPVNALNRKSDWTLSHISKEVGKAIAPSFANANPTATIVGVPASACGIAPRYYAFPYLVRLCSGLSVSHADSFNVLTVDATAGMRFASKVAAGHNLSVSAVANAVPEYLTVNVFSCAGFNQKPMEFLTSKVLAFAHFVTSKLLTVKKAWQSAVRQIFGSYPSQAGRILA